MTGTEDEKRYYTKFLEKYKDIKVWHEKLQSEAIRFKQISLPTGRQYAFPYAERTPWGGSTYGTQIKKLSCTRFCNSRYCTYSLYKYIQTYERKRSKKVYL